jgi:hypothetical protein
MNETARALHDVSVLLREDYRQQTGIELPPPPPPPQRSLVSWVWLVPLLVAVIGVAVSPLFFPELFGRNGQAAEIERLRRDLRGAEETIRELQEKVKETESLQGRLARAEARAEKKATQLTEVKQKFNDLIHTAQKTREELENRVAILTASVKDATLFPGTREGKVAFPVLPEQESLRVIDVETKTIIYFPLSKSTKWVLGGGKTMDRPPPIKGTHTVRLTVKKRHLAQVEIILGREKE